MLAAEDTVDQHVKLSVLEFARFQISSRPSGFDLYAGFFKKRDVAAYGLALDYDAVLELELFGDVLLRERMVVVAVFLEDLPDPDQREFLGLVGIHVDISRDLQTE